MKRLGVLLALLVVVLGWWSAAHALVIGGDEITLVENVTENPDGTVTLNYHLISPDVPTYALMIFKNEAFAVTEVDLPLGWLYETCRALEKGLADEDTAYFTYRDEDGAQDTIYLTLDGNDPDEVLSYLPVPGTTIFEVWAGVPPYADVHDAQFAITGFGNPDTPYLAFTDADEYLGETVHAPAAPVPEPATGVLVLVGGLGLLAAVFRRSREATSTS